MINTVMEFWKTFSTSNELVIVCFAILFFFFSKLISSRTSSKQQKMQCSFEELEKTAYHEAGHAIIARMLGADIKEISIEPTPKLNRTGHIEYKFAGNCHKKSELLDIIETTLGGMAAEIVIYGETSCGPFEDLNKAKREALHMIENLAMGNKILYSKEDPELFVEANDILQNARKNAVAKLTRNEDILHLLKRLLLEQKTLHQKEIENFFLTNGL